MNWPEAMVLIVVIASVTLIINTFQTSWGRGYRDGFEAGLSKWERE